jgi:hypothetical protein
VQASSPPFLPLTKDLLRPHLQPSMKPTAGSAAMKAIDYADTSHPLHDLHEEQHEDSQTSLSDTATNSSDEFWEDAAKEAGGLKRLDETRAKRGRRLYLAFMRLYRPIRVLFVAVLGAGILITPFLIFRLSFPHSVARPHVVAWSIWFTITWACGAVISILIDIMPRILLSLILNVFGKPPESLTTELEVCSLIFLMLGSDSLCCIASFSWLYPFG